MAAQRTSRHRNAIAQRTADPPNDAGQLAFPLFDTPDTGVATSDAEEQALPAPANGGHKPPRQTAVNDLRPPHDRALVARIAAAERWARTADRTAATAPARRGLAAKFEREADPDGVLPPDERARRAAR